MFSNLITLHTWLTAKMYKNESVVPSSLHSSISGIGQLNHFRYWWKVVYKTRSSVARSVKRFACIVLVKFQVLVESSI